MLNAVSITIWTDVSGVYSADPRRVSSAQIIPEVSYTEAIELAYFGAKVIHPKTMSPAILAQIPIYIRNTFEPQHPGTRIYLAPEKGQVIREQSVCGFTTVDGIVLMNIEGSGMIGVPGIAHRLFGALKSANISVMYIAQASSEYSICFATKEIYTDITYKAVNEAFFYELKQGFISNIRVIKECAIIAAVGESMSNRPGVSGVFFGALGDASINILSISQGCDERNISAVVYAKEATKALNAVHSAFWLSSLDLTIGIIGTGRVGTAIILSLLEQLDVINHHFGLNIKIRGILNSHNMLLGQDLSNNLIHKLDKYFISNRVNARSRTSSHSSISELLDNSIHNQLENETQRDGIKRSRSNLSLEEYSLAGRSLLNDNNNETTNNHSNINDDSEDIKPANIEEFFNHIKSGNTPHAIIIDASTSDVVANLHPKWLNGEVHIVTANKRAIATSLELYNSVYSAVRSSNKMYMSEVTIGASLPIRTILNDMLSSGDAVHSIIGLMSVSIGVVLNEILDNGLSFTQALSKTQKTGLFEDDVFLDLEGTETAQKLLIVARELGCAMSIEDIEVEVLAKRRPVQSWNNINGLFDEEDQIIAQRIADAKSRGCTLRYVQRIVCNPAAELINLGNSTIKASVKLEEVPYDSPYAAVKGAVYYFAFHTERYSQNPLIIQVSFNQSYYLWVNALIMF